MEKSIATERMGFIMLKLALFIIAVVTVFITIPVLPPLIQIYIVLTLTLSGGLLCGLTDKSILQKRE